MLYYTETFKKHFWPPIQFQAKKSWMQASKQKWGLCLKPWSKSAKNHKKIFQKAIILMNLFFFAWVVLKYLLSYLCSTASFLQILNFYYFFKPLLERPVFPVRGRLSWEVLPSDVVNWPLTEITNVNTLYKSISIIGSLYMSISINTILKSNDTPFIMH